MLLRDLELITQWLLLPAEIRYAIIILCSVLLGAVANWIIYTLAYFPRPISPWATAAENAPPRRWSDRIPVIGWLGLRREAHLHGKGFWVRPMLIELVMPFVLCWYYQYLTIDWMLIPAEAANALRLVPVQAASMTAWTNTIFFSHLVLIGLMVAATFVDFDEQTVPDWITVPGTLLALLFASLSEHVWMPYLFAVSEGRVLMPTFFTAPGTWNVQWDGPAGLWLSIGIYSGWCFALADRRLILRRGLGKAIQFFLAGLVRHPSWKLLVLIWIVGLIGIGIVHSLGGSSWASLLTALMGLAVGGGAVWAVRLVASGAMRQEAMGFGDVTLMAMIGAFIGWQAALMAFALAPMTAILIVLIQFILTRNRVVAFGPYLCAGSVVTVVFWDQLWAQFGDAAFGLGPTLPAILISLLGLMGVMLMAWRWVKESILGVQ